MESLSAYIPTDRRVALAQGQNLPDRAQGAVLFVDISGFTTLTKMLSNKLGPHRGAEELTHHLNNVYDGLIAQGNAYRGSVIGFGGDGIMCCSMGMMAAALPLAP